MFQAIKTWWRLHKERKALAGMSHAELLQFRRDCVSLCVPTGTTFHVKHPLVGQMEFYPGVLPRFEARGRKYNLQFPKHGYPYWDITCGEREPQRAELNSPDAVFINALLKEFVRFFPFAPAPLTGEPIA